MSLIVCGVVAPVALALIVWVRTTVQLTQHAPDEPSTLRAAGSASTARAGNRWAGRTEEIAQRGNQRPRRLDDAAARRRHLAAVLAADPRR